MQILKVKDVLNLIFFIFKANANVIIFPTALFAITTLFNNSYISSYFFF